MSQAHGDVSEVKSLAIIGFISTDGSVTVLYLFEI